MSSRAKKKLAYATLSWPPHAVGYVVAPLLVTRLGGHHGWRAGRPTAVNAIGVVPLVLGAAVIGWAIVSHYRASPDAVHTSLRPTYLVTSGVYASTRNPLYVGGLCMWLGWTIVFGSVPVLVGALLLTVGFSMFAVPFEERQLTRAFGSAYSEYAARVPRWVGWGGRSRG